jgi:hypothetical protein
MVQLASKVNKKSWRGKKLKSKGDGLLDSSPSAASVAKPAKSFGTVCFYCKEEGHWKRNCTKHQDDKAKSGSGTSNSGTLVVHVIDLYLSDSPSNTWVYDTGSVVHICNSMQGLVRHRSVKRGEVDIRVGNKVRVPALAVGTMQLQLPSGFMLNLIIVIMFLP